MVIDSYVVEWMKMLLEPAPNSYLLLSMPRLLMTHHCFRLGFASFLLNLERLAFVFQPLVLILLGICFWGLLLCYPRCVLLICNLVQEASSPNRTLDLTSALETGPAENKVANDLHTVGGTSRSVMTIAFQFAFESHMQESVASMARQYVRSIISSVQRVALALSPSHLGSHGGLRSPLGTPEAHTLARWICQSYRFVTVLYTCMCV